MLKPLEIRNSTAEFLIFQIEGKEDGVQVLYRDETIWCTQKAMSVLFDVGIPAISKHLKNIIDSGELCEDSVVSKMEITADDGKMPPVGTHRVRPCFINAIHGRIQCVPANFVFPMLKSNNCTHKVRYFQNNAPTGCKFS